MIRCSKPLRTLLLIVPLALTAAAAFAAPAEGLDNETCLTCHESDKPVVDPKFLKDSVHGSLNCVDCHSAIKETPHEDRVPRVNCGACHAKEFEAYSASVHGKAFAAGKRDAPTCSDCHGEHGIRAPSDPRSSVYATNVSEKTCGSCHGVERVATKYSLPSDRVKTYLASYHGLASKFGRTTVANCASCHGAHAILPSSDPKSSIHKANLPVTCGQCHPNVGEQLAKGSVHVSDDRKRDFAVYWTTVFYLFLIFIVIGGMLVHNALDFGRKFRDIYAHRYLHHERMRFTSHERMQHHVLIVAFVLLAYSGFALKFSGAWWAAPLAWFDGDLDVRGWLHRISAVVFSVLAVWHGGYLVLTRRGRHQLNELRPRLRDLKDFISMLRYNLGRGGQKPEFGHYGYVEKAEYWALVWGSGIMIATGGLLWLANLSMRWLPKWVLDVAVTIHFYEAVLATLAILVWHFYFTIFDPEHYPLNLSIFTGKEAEKKKVHPAEEPKKDADEKP